MFPADLYLLMPELALAGMAIIVILADLVRKRGDLLATLCLLGLAATFRHRQGKHSRARSHTSLLLAAGPRGAAYGTRRAYSCARPARAHTRAHTRAYAP